MIARLLHERLLVDPERPVLVDAGAGGGDREERIWSAGELDRVALRWARVLTGRRRVGLSADNGLELAGALLGALYAGAAVVPFHVGTPALEVQARMQRFGVDCLLFCDEVFEATRELATWGTAPVEGDAPALLLGTSGTTGEPRTVVITQRGLAAHALSLVAATGLGPADRVLAMLPLAHSYGCRMALIVPLLAGACVVLTRRFSAQRTLGLVAEQRITWAPVVPTMLSAWVAVPASEIEVPSTLRWVLSAGAPLADALRVRAEARLGCEVREGYGLTEASFSTLDAPPGARTPGTVGQAVRGVEVRLAPETQEVELRGDNVMAEYLDDADATRAAFTEDGWLRTGDIGAFDGAGNLRIVERSKDIVLRGGHTIYPAEVEAVLARHPAVLAVAVVGREHAHLGEEVVAHVVMRKGWRWDEGVGEGEGVGAGVGAGAGEGAGRVLTEWSRQWLAPHKVPTQVVFQAELPLGPSGKVLKRRLRAGFGLPDEGSGG